MHTFGPAQLLCSRIALAIADDEADSEANAHLLNVTTCYNDV